MKKSKFDNVYVEYKRDPISKEEFLSAILVEKGDSTLYYSVPNYYLKLNSKQKLKFQDKLSEKLKELKTHVGKDKIVINTEDGLRKIEQFEQEQLRFTNTYDLVVFVQMALPFIYPPHAGVLSYLLSVNSLLQGATLIQRNRNLPKCKTFNRLKVALSAFLISLNVSFGIKNFSVNMDVASKQVHSLRRDLLLGRVENPFSDGNEMVTDKDAAVNLLMGAFELNPFIEEEDAKIATSLKQYFLDNPYLDYERIYDCYLSFDIIDSSRKDDASVMKRVARYDSFNNIIYQYNNDGKEKSFEDYRSDLGHELVHATGNLESTFLNEGMTTIISSEYIDDFSLDRSGYYDHVLITRCLCEIIGADKMLEAYSQDNMDIIRDELLKLNSDIRYYEQFIEVMDNYQQALTSEDFDYMFSSKPKFIQALAPYLENIPEENLARIGEYFQLLNTFDYDAVPKVAYYNHEALTKKESKTK